ncbi:MAG: MaoC family dehydratase N-terminal domain-containing protein [Acidobacteria bacterium]|nr:MaoC family dehydratase N-terminal domain-containing protein [Acidobacteriota bacterium]MBI3472673.1 MaoC family dehydratase N-terminal domain-containing protein [Candidatus Solibacter usitatus]
MSLYFEDFAVGQEYATRGRTITEADVVGFAGLSGDFVELHTNEEYARQGPFGRRIAHGLLTLSVSSGLMVQTNLVLDSVVAFYGIDRLRFTQPVFPGDTIHVVKRVIETREKEKTGVVTFQTTVLNQNNETVLVYQDKLAVKKKAGHATA